MKFIICGVEVECDTSEFVELLAIKYGLELDTDALGNPIIK